MPEPFDEQIWLQEPIKCGSESPCNSVKKNWPYKVCNRPLNHTGDHSYTVQNGSKIVDFWWKKGK
jgi:hypothetical protein